MKNIWALLSLFVLASCSGGELLQVCPDELVVNEMPSTNVEVETNEYYLLDGTRREIEEFDAEYVTENCEVPEQIVY